VTGFRFDLALREPGRLANEIAELDGIPLLGHKLRVMRDGAQADMFIIAVTWFHAPGALSKSGLLTLSEHFP